MPNVYSSRWVYLMHTYLHHQDESFKRMHLHLRDENENLTKNAHVFISWTWVFKTNAQVFMSWTPLKRTQWWNWCTWGHRQTRTYMSYHACWCMCNKLKSTPKKMHISHLKFILTTTKCADVNTFEKRRLHMCTTTQFRMFDSLYWRKLLLYMCMALTNVNCICINIKDFDFFLIEIDINFDMNFISFLFMFSYMLI